MSMGDRTFSRRSVLTGSLAAAGTALVASCGNSPSGGDAQTQGSAESGVINVWGAITLDRGVQELLDAFAAKYPDIQVNYEQFPNNTDGNLKLDTSLQGGAPVDVFFSYGAAAVARRTEAGYALDLTELAQSMPEAEPFTSSDPQRTALFDDKLFAIPTVYNPYLVYLNQDMLDAAGIDVPFDWTIEEFHEIATELTAGGFAESATYKSLPLAGMELGGDSQFAAGGESSSFDLPIWKQQFDLELAMEQDGTLFPMEQVLAQRVDLYAQSYFLGGQHAFYLDNPATLRFVKDLENYPHDFRTTFRPMPYLERGGQQWNTGSYEDAVQINANTSYPEAAKTFVQFWLQDGSEFMQTAGKVPSSLGPGQGAAAEALFPRLLGDDYEDLFDTDALTQVAFADDIQMSVTTITTALTEIANLRSSLTQQLRLGEISVDDMLGRLKAEADAAITTELAQG
ncbi:ABC transporter substrate-binding protein [Occultella gossypii]|uniref:Carbohydrate ABC transporter substrate-binding protein n=1 Tax=Occultella gossypii TaxID=2800820 RepID=A0ABS7S3D9_9MICO|nr:ABC transporter substrate-binding protein [Occultella gossypii]MBZ2194856.1 carbohydrate ABC transporter substrate-binding protein [Occultella gossypii]